MRLNLIKRGWAPGVALDGLARSRRVLAAIAKLPLARTDAELARVLSARRIVNSTTGREA